MYSNPGLQIRSPICSQFWGWLQGPASRDTPSFAESGFRQPIGVRVAPALFFSGASLMSSRFTVIFQHGPVNGNKSQYLQPSQPECNSRPYKAKTRAPFG